MSGGRTLPFDTIEPSRLPARTISGTFYRQTKPHYRATDLPRQAESDARNHRQRHEPPLYASSTEDAAWGELFRHHLDVDVSPFEVRRRMTTLDIRELPVLDLTDPNVRALLGVSEEELTANDYTVCQAVTDLVRLAPGRFGGLLQPSAAIRGEQTLVVFQEWFDAHVFVVQDPIMTAPVRLFGLFELIIDTLPARLRAPLRKLAGLLQRDVAP